jgi:ComF family protein
VSSEVCQPTPRSRIAIGPHWLKKAWDATLDLVFPPRCVACGCECEPPLLTPLFCPTCAANLAPSERHACLRCANLCSEIDVARGDCGQCRSNELLFRAARAIGPYEGALRQAVLQAKHAAYEPLAGALGHLLEERIRQSPFAEPPEAVVAVPMHWLKRAWRHTNPEESIGRVVARQLGVDYLSGAIVCRRYLQRQALLNPVERKRNVRGAYRAARFAKVAGKRILLIDDVMTTGATAQECTRALLDAGASAVVVATVARASANF